MRHLLSSVNLYPFPGFDELTDCPLPPVATDTPPSTARSGGAGAEDCREVIDAPINKNIIKNIFPAAKPAPPGR